MCICPEAQFTRKCCDPDDAFNAPSELILIYMMGSLEKSIRFPTYFSVRFPTNFSYVSLSPLL